MIEMQTDTCEETLRQVAALMMNAARTAPKARGVDNLLIAMLTGEDRLRLADKLRQMGEESGRGFFLRDAENVHQAGVVVLIGSRYETLGLNCGWCGFPTCEQKALRAPLAPCAFNTNDLGIAVGSAVSVAADHRTDCRVLFSAGVAALALDLLPEARAILAIPLSATAKNPFFDRKPL